MPVDLLLRLLGIFAIIGLGWIAGRAGWIDGPDASAEAGGRGRRAAEVLSNTAFALFMPALLFRTTARLDVTQLPWRLLAVFFVPLWLLMGAVYVWQRRQVTAGSHGAPDDASAAAPAVRALAVGFGNTVQLGIPLAAALFGEAGLAIHLAVVSLHALMLLIVSTAMVEVDLARARARRSGQASRLGTVLWATARRTVIHPVVLPVVAGLCWNLGGVPLPEVVDGVLALLAQAAVPICLIVIGLSFSAQSLHGLRQVAGMAVATSAAKLLLLPALVLVSGLVVGLEGPALAVVTMCSALPTGSNALIFAQRYRALTDEVTVVTVLSTLAFALTAPLWLLVFGAIGLG